MFDLKALEDIFRHKVFKMLLSRKKITEEMVDMLTNPASAGVRYYGHYSPASRGIRRGKRKKQDQDDIIPSILALEGSPKAFRKNWARLIQKIYELDPLTCPKCSNKMRVISVIEDKEIIKKILKHLNLWDRKARQATAQNEGFLPFYAFSPVIVSPTIWRMSFNLDTQC